MNHDVTNARLDPVCLPTPCYVHVIDCHYNSYMANSTVVELGSHESLLKQEGGYAKLYNIQAAQFR